MLAVKQLLCTPSKICTGIAVKNIYQYVMFKGGKSEMFQTVYGIPQGSKLVNSLVIIFVFQMSGKYQRKVGK